MLSRDHVIDTSTSQISAAVAEIVRVCGRETELSTINKALNVFACM